MPQLKSINLEKIKRLRKERKISQEKMAQFLGYKTATGYNYLESGRCKISAEQLQLIATILGVASEDLFFDPVVTDSVA